MPNIGCQVGQVWEMLAQSKPVAPVTDQGIIVKITPTAVYLLSRYGRQVIIPPRSLELSWKYISEARVVACDFCNEVACVQDAKSPTWFCHNHIPKTTSSRFRFPSDFGKDICSDPCPQCSSSNVVPAQSKALLQFGAQFCRECTYLWVVLIEKDSTSADQIKQDTQTLRKILQEQTFNCKVTSGVAAYEALQKSLGIELHPEGVDFSRVPRRDGRRAVLVGGRGVVLVGGSVPVLRQDILLTSAGVELINLATQLGFLWHHRVTGDSIIITSNTCGSSFPSSRRISFTTPSAEVSDRVEKILSLKEFTDTYLHRSSEPPCKEDDCLIRLDDVSNDIYRVLKVNPDDCWVTVEDSKRVQHQHHFHEVYRGFRTLVMETTYEILRGGVEMFDISTDL